MTKKAVISTGGKQYLIKEGDELEVELLNEQKSVKFGPLLIIDEGKIKIGKPEVKEAGVNAQVIEASKKSPKVTAIRYKAKKRVKKIHGHRQSHSVIKITKIV